MRLLTSFSTVCVKNPAVGGRGMWTSTCLKSERKFFLFKNQRLMVRFVRLRTILSTKNVQNGRVELDL
jgi:hypothetical protein